MSCSLVDKTALNFLLLPSARSVVYFAFRYDRSYVNVPVYHYTVNPCPANKHTCCRDYVGFEGCCISEFIFDMFLLSVWVLRLCSTHTPNNSLSRIKSIWILKHTSQSLWIYNKYQTQPCVSILKITKYLLYHIYADDAQSTWSLSQLKSEFWVDILCELSRSSEYLYDIMLNLQKRDGVQTVIRALHGKGFWNEPIILMCYTQFHVMISDVHFVFQVLMSLEIFFKKWDIPAKLTTWAMTYSPYELIVIHGHQIYKIPNK